MPRRRLSRSANFRSIDHRDRVDLDEAARVGREPHHLHGRGRGLGVVEIFRPDAIERILVPRVDIAIDCGFAANPERIYSQIEGAAVMGLSLARYGEISFKNGRVEQNNFDGFQVLRIDESPPITHVWIVPNSIDVPSSGVGEPGLPPFAPALCNAIFAPASASGICRSAISWRPRVQTNPPRPAVRRGLE